MYLVNNLELWIKLLFSLEFHSDKNAWQSFPKRPYNLGTSVPCANYSYFVTQKYHMRKQNMSNRTWVSSNLTLVSCRIVEHQYTKRNKLCRGHTQEQLENDKIQSFSAFPEGVSKRVGLLSAWPPPPPHTSLLQQRLKWIKTLRLVKTAKPPYHTPKFQQYI